METRSRLGRFWVAVVALVAISAPTGCYYFSAQDSIREATEALDAAKEAGAGEKAPYEYTLAEQYLDRAKSENRLSDFAAAKEFADQAKNAAEKSHHVSAGGAVAP